MKAKSTTVKMVDSSKRRDAFFKLLNSILLFVILISSIIFFSVKSEDFLTVNNIIIIAVSISSIGIVCIGQSLLLISGSFDISVGSIVGFSGVVLAKLLEVFGITSTGGSILMIFVVIAIGCLVGLINGLLVTKIGINALITTIAMLSLVVGFSMAITKGEFISINNPFFIALGSGEIGGVVPISILILVIIYIAFFIILKTTVFGRYIYAVGNNETAARYAGINVDLIRIILFVISGASSALAGIILASKLTSAQAIFGANYPLITIAACVLGGCAISGGKGGVLGSLLGIGFLLILRNGLVLNGLPTHMQDLFTGVILILALFLSGFWNKNK